MAAYDNSNKSVATNARRNPPRWVPDLPRVRCRRCGDESLGPWVPMGHQTFLCTECWEWLLEFGNELPDGPEPPDF